MQEETDKRLNILIVEDDSEMQDLYRFFFKGMEEIYRVDIEGDAKSALRRLREVDYHLIILDILMEHMNGETFFIYIRNHTKTMATPVIIVSVVEEEQLDRIEELGHVWYLQKPVEREALLMKIDEIMT